MAHGRNATVNSIQALLIGAPTNTPIPLLPSDCQLWIDLTTGFLIDAFVSTKSTWQRTVAIPNDVGLRGVVLTWQALEFPLPVTRTTNAVRTAIDNF